MNKFFKINLWILGSLLGLLALFLISIWIFSGNTPEGGTPIAKKKWTQIGGMKQGLFIRGEKATNPVILFLHGGPGSQELPFIKETKLETFFTVCYWDQRGAGMTYRSDIDPATMTIAQFVEDTRQLTDSLRKWYGVEKIYLMGHSWGTYLGIKTIEKYPERYHAYIGIGQISNQLESERQAYDYLIFEARKIGDTKTEKALGKYDKMAADFPTTDYLLKVRSRAMNQYGVGIMHKNCSMSDLVMAVLYYRGYTFRDKIHYAQGSLFSINQMFHNVLEDNLFESSTTFEIPIYFIQGKYDYQVSYTLAKAYLDSLDAPQKAFYTFEESAHSPNLEEPKRFVEIVCSLSENVKKAPTTKDSVR